jgi:single-strand DNA-binding protein
MAINVITVSGHVGKDAVVRVTPNGKHIANFSLPTTSGYGDNAKTSWLNCKMFGAMAEKLSQGIVKGAKVTVVGEFVLEEWTKQDGSQASVPTILVRDIDMPPKSQGNSHGNSGQRGNPQPHQAQNAQPMDFDDDIPFAPICLQHPNHAIYSL